jgi:hypothetical protein
MPTPWLHRARQVALWVNPLLQFAVVVVLWVTNENWWLPVWARVLWLAVIAVMLGMAVLAWIGRRAEGRPASGQNGGC